MYNKVYLFVEIVTFKIYNSFDFKLKLLTRLHEFGVNFLVLFKSIYTLYL